MNENRFWELLSLKLSGEATSEELTELSILSKEQPDSYFKSDLLEKLWNEKHQAELDKNSDEAFSQHLQRLSNYFADPALQYDKNFKKATKGGKRKSFIWIGLSAAAAILAFVLTYVFTIRTTYHNPAQNVVVTKPGSKSKISLPDGTQVWLNADSKITYNGAFGSTVREVELTGEAFFDVFKDKEHPFIIHTKSIDVKVLGTAFNIRSYPNEKVAETSLIRGIVEVTLKDNPDRKIILRPNEKLVVQINSQPVEVAKAETNNTDNPPMLVLTNLHYFKGDSTSVETSWTKNKLVFDSESLENVARKIERWYGVEISLTDEKLKSELYTSVFEDESLPEVMHALQLTGNFKYTINRKEITILP